MIFMNKSISANTFNKKVLLPAIFLFFHSFNFAYADTKPIRENVQSNELEFEVIIEPKTNTVEVIPNKIQSANKIANPPQTMKLKLFSKDLETKPIKLQVMQVPESTYPKYSGKLDRWNSSFIGFELNFSLDNKQWKKIRKEFDREKP